MRERQRTSGTRVSNDTNSNDKPLSTNEISLGKLLLSFPIGVGFGIALEKGRVFSPQVIVQQLLLQDFTMMKMFLSATLTSMIVITALAQGSRKELILKEIRKKYFGERGLLLTIIGSFILGMGMATSGACPGTVFAQIGTGIIWGLCTLIGGLIGSFIYGQVFDDRVANLKRVWLYDDKNGSLDLLLSAPFWKASLPVMIVLTFAIGMFDYYFPYKELSYGNWLTVKSWNPILSGIAVGSLNLPSIILLNNVIGSSSSFPTITSYITRLILPSDYILSKYLQKSVSAFSSWYQPTYLAGCITGAAISSSLSGSSAWALPVTSSGMGPLLSIVGGCLLLFGARMANGCPSGHGISGFSLLAVVSCISVPAMFAGGILTAFVLRSVGIYPAHILAASI